MKDAVRRAVGWRVRNRDERGAMAIFIAIVTCFMLIPLAAFAVDIGVQRVARRDAQAVADLVALDLARQLNGDTYSQIMARTPSPQTLANDSAKRNSNGGDSFTIKVEFGSLADAFDVDHPESYFTPSTVADSRPKAVRITATGKVAFTFISGTGGVGRQAVATAKPKACFKIGTFEVGLATNGSALDGLLNGALNVNTNVLGYNGLANADVSLLGLATQLGAGSVSELVNLKNLTLGQIVNASALVLANTAPHDAADVTLLQSIRTRLSSNAAGKVVDLGSLIDVGKGNSSGLDASLNLLDLISGAAYVANGTSAVSVPGLNLNLPFVGSLTTRVSVVEPPRIACLGGTARTGQFRLTVDGNLSTGVPLVLTVSGPIRIEIGLAVATGTLKSVDCQAGVATGVKIAVNEQQAATIRLSLGNPDTNTWLGVRAVLGLVTIPLLNASVSTNQSTVTNTYNLTPWQNYVDTPFSTPQVADALPNFSASVGLLGINLGGLLNDLLSVVLNPLVNAVNGLVSNVLAPALGLQLAGVDLWVIDPPAPTCLAPTLVN